MMDQYCNNEYKKFEEEYSQNLKEIEIELRGKYQQLITNYNETIANFKIDERKFKEALHQSEEDFDIDFQKKR